MLSLRFGARERSNHERESGTSRTEKCSRNGTDFLRICELTTSASLELAGESKTRTFEPESHCSTFFEASVSRTYGTESFYLLSGEERIGQ